MRKLKEFIKRNKKLYAFLKNIRKNYQNRKKLRCKIKYVNRSKGKKKLCIVLAGYKQFLYDDVFGRLSEYLEDDIDVCVVTSGKEDEVVSEICFQNQWSYLSTKINNVSLAQNIAISLHPDAKIIFKMDEDIFLTKGYFNKMCNAYDRIISEGSYNPGFLAPIIPINAYGYMRVLEKLGLLEIYKSKFEMPKYEFGKIHKDPEVAKFFWGEGGYVPQIDEMNLMFEKSELYYTICPIRYSIGAIMFTRELFENMGMFHVATRGNAMGEDEKQICEYCIQSSQPIFILEDTVVGHLSYGPQNEVMNKYYAQHRDKFSCN